MDVRGDYGQIEIHLKRTGFTKIQCPVYFFTREENNMIGVKLGEMAFVNGSADFGTRFDCKNIKNSNYDMREMKGLLIPLNEKIMFASQWDEKEITRENFKEYDERNHKEVREEIPQSDANTRDLMMRYGFSNSEAYGYTKAMGALGFESEEDLMYANQQELELFRKSFEKYSGKYNELYNSGMFDSMQEFNTQMEEFKEDVKLEVVDFFMNNQDTIRAAMKGIISLAEFAITALGKIVQWLNPDARTSDSQKAANTASFIAHTIRAR